jgi:hypothetical protein
MQKKDRSHKNADLLALTADALQGKQSVRVTFRLPEEAIALLSMAASQLGIQQKSLFNQLVENQEILNRMATEGRSYDVSHDERVQKTYVISRNALISLKKISKQNDISRDSLVELSINRLRPVIHAEQEKLKHWKIFHSKIVGLLHNGQQILVEAADILTEEDPVYRKLEGSIAGLEKCYEEIDQMIKKGNRMDTLT